MTVTRKLPNLKYLLTNFFCLQNKPLVHQPETLKQFDRLSLAPPTSLLDVTVCAKELEEKKVIQGAIVMRVLLVCQQQPIFCIQRVD